jgi:hypothetical protein
MKDFKAKVEEHKKKFNKALTGAKDTRALQEVRNAFLSRKKESLKSSSKS